MEDLVRIAISLPRGLLKSFDAASRRKGLTNRSEAIRELVRGILVEEEWTAGTGDAVGTVTLVYDHETLDLPRKLTRIQHSRGKWIVSTLHVHLDLHNCLEVLVLRGPANRVRALGEGFTGVKGVKHAKFTMTTSGRHLH